MRVLEDTRSIYTGADSPSREDPSRVFDVATYNVHRWSGVTGGRRWTPELAIEVIGELDVDVVALQEVLRPDFGQDPLREIARRTDLYYAFVPTRAHRYGVLGNAILSRWPMKAVFPLNLSFSRIEQRGAVVAQFEGTDHVVTVIATHLAIVDRTRKLQVRSLLNHPGLQGPTLLLGDMNAWRRCGATRELDRELTALHDNLSWPLSYPATRPVLALDRIYARGARITGIRVHNTPASRLASDHLPVIARVTVKE